MMNGWKEMRLCEEIEKKFTKRKKGKYLKIQKQKNNKKRRIHKEKFKKKERVTLTFWTFIGADPMLACGCNWLSRYSKQHDLKVCMCVCVC